MSKCPLFKAWDLYLEHPTEYINQGRGGAYRSVPSLIICLTAFLFLSCPEAAALGLRSLIGPIPGDADVISRTAVVFIINAIHSLASHLKLLLRSLKQVGKCSALIFIEASAAGFTALLCLASVYDDLAFTAAVVRIVHTAGYITV